MLRTPDRRRSVLASVRLWLHPRVGWELGSFYGRWLHRVAEYLLNRAHGIRTPEVEPGMLDPRWPLRDVRRRFGRTKPR
jgi:hypothetical protein